MMKTTIFVLLVATSIIGLILQSQMTILPLSQTHDKLSSKNILMEDCECVTLAKGNTSKFHMEANVGETNKTVKMLFNLHWSTTLLASNNDLGFEPFDCENCTKYPNETSHCEDPQFFGLGYLVETNLNFGKKAWTSNTKALFSSNYTVHKVQYFGNETSGILGLGISGQALSNFQSLNPMSSLSFSNSTNGELCICKNQSNVSPKTPLTKISVDNNWEIKSQGMKFGNKYFDKNLINLILDPNESQIVCPLWIFEQFLAAVNGTTIPIKCQIHGESDNYRATCIYHGEIQDLPSIIFPVDNGEIVINPMEYILNPETFNKTEGNFTFNIRASSTRAENEQNFVTHPYKNYVKLGYNFMKNRVFNFKAKDSVNPNNTIEYYDQFDDSFSQWSSWWIICGGILVGLLVLISFLYLEIQAKQARRKEKALEEKFGNISTLLDKVNNDDRP